MGPGGALAGGVLEGLFVDELFVEADVDRVSGGHHVVEVDDLDEGLHLVALGDLLLAHGEAGGAQPGKNPRQ